MTTPSPAGWAAATTPRTFATIAERTTAWRPSKLTESPPSPASSRVGVGSPLRVANLLRQRDETWHLRGAGRAVAHSAGQRTSNVCLSFAGRGTATAPRSRRSRRETMRYLQRCTAYAARRHTELPPVQAKAGTPASGCGGATTTGACSLVWLSGVRSRDAAATGWVLLRSVITPPWGALSLALALAPMRHERAHWTGPELVIEGSSSLTSRPIPRMNVSRSATRHTSSQPLFEMPRTKSPFWS